MIAAADKVLALVGPATKIIPGPTKDLDEKWGRGFMKPEPWLAIVYARLKGK